MNTKFISTLIAIIICAMTPAKAQQGFTNNAEAKNEIKNGHKDGKWIEYTGGTSILRSDSEGAASYVLTMYKDDKPSGTVREYDMSGILIRETIYENGAINGIEKMYHENGYHLETPYKNGKKEGIEKLFDDNGKLVSESPYKGDQQNGVAKEYYESGKLKSATTYKDGVPGTTKNYDETGKEMK